MQAVWTKILEFWKRYPLISTETLGAGATTADVEYLEKRLGKRLPKDFVDFYRIHNGWRELVMPRASLLLTLDEISEYARLVAKRPLDNFSILIPFTVSSRNRDFFCLNLGENNSGTIVFVSTDVPESFEIASTFREWITLYADNPVMPV